MLHHLHTTSRQLFDINADAPNNDCMVRFVTTISFILASPIHLMIKWK